LPLKTLKINFGKGIAWVTLSSCITQPLSFVIKMVLTRKLAPEDFGVVAVGLLVINSLGLLKEMGMGTALVQRKEKLQDASSTAFFIVLFTSTILYCVSFFSAGLMAYFFNSPAVKPILRALSLSFLISSFGIIPSSLLSRDLMFKKRFIPEVVSVILFGIASIWMAYAGFGIWSLAIGYLISVLADSALSWIILKWKFTFVFDREIAKEILIYGSHILTTNMLAYFMLQGANAVIGRISGMKILGYYSMAFSISSLPFLGITSVIARVAFPTFARLQEDKRNLSRAFKKILEYLLLLILPMAIGIYILSPSFIKVVMTEKWLPMQTALQILCFFTVFRSLHMICGFLTQAVGKPKLQRNLVFWELLLLSIIIYPLTKLWGANGACVSMLLVITVGSILLLLKSWKILSLQKSEILELARVPVLATLIMSLAVILINKLAHPTVSFFGLSISILTGGLVYLFSILMLKKDLKKEIVELISLSNAK